MRQSIPKSLLVQTRSVKEAIGFSNDYAPEHLILHVRHARVFAEEVRNVSSVFIGRYYPERWAYYPLETSVNHSDNHGQLRIPRVWDEPYTSNERIRLPAQRVNAQTFQKHITSQELTEEGLKALGPTVAALADVEGLGTHANAARIRLSEWKHRP